MAEIKVVKLGSTTYELNGKYIQDASGNPKSWADIVALSNGAKLEMTVVDSLPTASESTMHNIYLVADVLGHKDVNTTRKHYAALDDDSRRSAAKYVKLRDV